MRLDLWLSRFQYESYLVKASVKWRHAVVVVVSWLCQANLNVRRAFAFTFSLARVALLVYFQDATRSDLVASDFHL